MDLRISYCAKHNGNFYDSAYYLFQKEKVDVMSYQIVRILDKSKILTILRFA